MLAAYLDERTVPYRYESFGAGANPDFRADHPAAGEVVLEVYEPEYRLPRNPDGPISPGLLPRRDAWSGGGLPLAGSHGRLRSHATWAFRSCSSSPARTRNWQSTSMIFPVRCSGRQSSNGATPSGPRRAGRLVFGSGGRAEAHLNTRFSAVALVTRGGAHAPAGNGQAYRLQIFHNPFAAILLKREFAGPYDDQWAAVDSGRKYQQIGPD